MDEAAREIVTIAREVLEELDLEQVLERLVAAAQRLTRARYVALGVLDPERTRLERFVIAGLSEEERLAIGPPPTGRGVLGELIRNPVALRVADVSAHPASFGFPPGHPAMRSFLGVPILIDGQPYGNLYLAEKRDADEFSDTDQEAVVLLAEFASIAIDHARRFSGAESERAQLERTVRSLDATIQIARALGGETDLGAILDLVAKRGRALVSARLLVIELLEGDHLRFAAGAGELPAGLLGRRVPLAATVASAALRDGRTRRLADPEQRERFQHHGLGSLGLAVHDGLVVPLIFRGQRYGVLVAIDRRDTGRFSAEDERLLVSFAASAATAVATARSVADERRRQRIAAAEAERSRWARELHDETLQALASLRLQLSAGRRRGDADSMRTAIEGALEQLELDITTLRALITELRPAALDQLGLEPALVALVDRARTTGLDVDLHLELDGRQGGAPRRLTSELETSVYRIVQEALTNAGKHAQAEHATVTVTEAPEIVTVTVSDDGTGFDPSATSSGFGLVGMQERVELLGGELSVTSSPGEGTTLRATLPARRSARDGEGAADRPAILSAPPPAPPADGARRARSDGAAR